MVICFALGFRYARSQDTAVQSARPQPGDNSRHMEAAERDSGADALIAENGRLTAQLRSAERRAADALASAQAKEAELKARIALLENANAELTNSESGRTSQLAQLKKDLETLRSESEANRNAAARAQAELLDRGTELKRIATQLDDERRRNATLSEAQDLIVRPDVHVWPVYDTDENGRRLPAFGRILYQEGKKLLFYAYNLPESNSKGTKVSFYVWGEKPGTHQPIRNLGILRADDEKAHRWKLTFENPDILTAIDSVFVTGEPGRPAEPQGKRMLFASLDPKADHP